MAMRWLLSDVEAFHRACGHEVAEKPQSIRGPVYFLRHRLHQEEMRELDQAMLNDDLPAVADGLADLIYVLLGTALSYGIPLDRVWAEVQRANMAKVRDGAVLRDLGGKILKPEGWEPPAIAKIIEEAQGC